MGFGDAPLPVNVGALNELVNTDFRSTIRAPVSINTDLEAINSPTSRIARNIKPQEASKTLRDLQSKINNSKNELYMGQGRSKNRPFEPQVIKVIGKFSTLQKSLRLLRNEDRDHQPATTKNNSMLSTLNVGASGPTFLNAALNKKNFSSPPR